MRVLTLTAVFLLAAPIVASASTATCGWEGTDTILGSFGGIEASIAIDPVYAGSQSLMLERTGSSTPQAYVAWITGLDDGDTVAASFWRYDTDPSVAPRARIWGHWNDDPGDVNGYNGSAGGNSSYGDEPGWDILEHEWTVVDGHIGIVVEARVYSAAGDIVWIDNLTVTAPDGATIYVPEDAVSLYRSTWGEIKSLF